MTEHRYRIVVEGQLGPAICEAFAPLRVEALADATALTGAMDQAALYGQLQRITSLSLVLVEVRRLDTNDVERRVHRPETAQSDMIFESRS